MASEQTRITQNTGAKMSDSRTPRPGVMVGHHQAVAPDKP